MNNSVDVYVDVFAKRLNDVKAFLSKIESLPTNAQIENILNEYDDLLILLDSLYYIGRGIAEGTIILPENAKNAADYIFELSVQNINRDGLFFGGPINDRVMVGQKSSDAIHCYRIMKDEKADNTFLPNKWVARTPETGTQTA